MKYILNNIYMRCFESHKVVCHSAVVPENRFGRNDL